jgi:hypothetical protein
MIEQSEGFCPETAPFNKRKKSDKIKNFIPGDLSIKLRFTSHTDNESGIGKKMVSVIIT